MFVLNAHSKPFLRRNRRALLMPSSSNSEPGLVQEPPLLFSVEDERYGCHGDKVSADASSLRKADPKGRSALLADIQQGTRLRKVTQINDRSAPQIEGSKGTNKEGGGPANSRGGSTPPALGDLFAGGFPVLRPAGQRDAAGKEEFKLAIFDSYLLALRNQQGSPHLPISDMFRVNSHMVGDHLFGSPSKRKFQQRNNDSSTLPPEERSAVETHVMSHVSMWLLHHSQSRVIRLESQSYCGPAHLVSAPESPLPCPSHEEAEGVRSKRFLVVSKYFHRDYRIYSANSSSEVPPPLPRKSPSFQAQPPKPSGQALPAPPAPPGSQPFLQKKRPGRGPGTGGGKLNPPPAPPARSPTTELSSRSQQALAWTPTQQPGGQLRNGSLNIIDDFESKFTFHSMEDFPPPDEYKPCQKIYPSKIPRSRTPGPWLHAEAGGQSSDDIKGRNAQRLRRSGEKTDEANVL
ncbi:hypothetical protein E5288_WYG014360 [Bos mutus]|uniref:WH2 domain-containing protein n=1 Tax=Bos mutus TaxID=72004 RepID=A0A6B0RBG5_9CETA|nr:hypothetical protein [Bos mutus]